MKTMRTTKAYIFDMDGTLVDEALAAERPDILFDSFARFEDLAHGKSTGNADWIELGS